MVIERSEAGGIATLVWDDGKVNAMDAEVFRALDDAFDACADDAAIVVVGRPGMFSAGLNTKVLAGLDAAGLVDLLSAFGRTMLRIWLEPRPVVAAATGHAIAGGTILAMACDHAVAADGDHRWGLTETTIGFPQPEWILALARGNVRTDRLDDLVLPGRTVGPREAVDVGFADEVAPPDRVLDVATARASALAALPRGVYAETKRRLRAPLARPALDGLEADLETLIAVRGAVAAG